MKLFTFIIFSLIFVSLSDGNAIADKLIKMGSTKMKKVLKEAHGELKVHNAKLISTAFLNATSTRWRFSRIFKHFSEDPKHEGVAFEKFISQLKETSKNSVAEMEKLMSAELQNEVADKALKVYSSDLEDLLNRSMLKYVDRLNRGKLGCIMTQVKKGITETEGEMSELKEKFKKEAENNFENQLEIYLQKMNVIESTVTKTYENCYNDDDFEKCLEEFVQNPKVLKIPEVFSKVMNKILDVIMDGLNQVGPSIENIEEVLSKYTDKIEELMKECEI